MPRASVYNFQLGTVGIQTCRDFLLWASGPQASHLARADGCQRLDRKVPAVQGPHTHRQLLPLAVQGTATLGHCVVLGQLVLICGQYLPALLQALLQAVGNSNPEDTGQE